MEKTALIAVTNLHKTFGKNKVLQGVNFTVQKGENLVILGRSGSGKSVSIKCLVGLISADKGEMMIFGTDIAKLSYHQLNEIRLRIGFLFQGGALYDSMSVRDNMSFTLKHHSPDLSNKEVEKRIVEVLENVGLAAAIDKMPSELSGGMVKRTAVARTLIIQPEIILYDEPTAGLDTITAREISDLIVAVQEKYKTTAIIITHDLACAKSTGNRIMILKDGVINAAGTYLELENSEDEWVRSFFI